MTEEIIIDGVNVAGCGYFYNAYNKNMCARVDGLTCKEDDNCYYKQFKRLEQENKELRQQYNCYACDTCQGKEDYRNMKRHCENAIKTVRTYRSALEEIRANIQNWINSPWSCFNCRNNMDERLTEIQDKINECIGG